MEHAELKITKVTSDPEVKAIGIRAAQAKDYAEGLFIKTDDDEKDAIDALTKVGVDLKRAETLRRFFVDPYNAYVKSINAWFKDNGIDGLTYLDRLLRDKLSAYQDHKYAVAEAAKAKIMKQVESGKIGIEKAVAKIEHVAEPERIVRSDAATVTYKMVREVVIEDAALLPREYLIPDEQKIKKVAMAGIVIPGVKVVEKKQTSLRRF